MKRKSTHGGKREGSGRKPLGKSHYNVTLTVESVNKVKEREDNFSGLLDRLLSEWISASADIERQPNSQDSGLESEFDRLCANWKEETGGMSSLSQITSNKNYLGVIALGQAAIPFILEELKSDPAPWFAALRALSGRDDIGRDTPGKFRQIADAWIRWGTENGLTKEASFA
jgi:hypothetical protein